MAGSLDTVPCTSDDADAVGDGTVPAGVEAEAVPGDGTGAVEATVDVSASSSLPHDASSAAAAGAVRPSNINRRTASRRLNSPSAQSSAISEAR